MRTRAQTPLITMARKLTSIPTESPRGQDLVDSLQRSLIVAALVRHGGNRWAAAEELNVHPSTLWRRVKKLGIELPEVEPVDLSVRWEQGSGQSIFDPELKCGRPVKAARFC